MSDLIAVAYDQEETAEKALEKLQQMQVEHLIQLEDAAYVTRGEDGKTKMHQTVPMGALGAAQGAMWGTLFGLLFFVPFIGLAVGTGAGYLMGKTADVGIDDRLAKRIGEKLQPGTSALFLLVQSVTADKVLPEVARFGGEVLQTSLPHDAEDRLKAALAQRAA